MNFSDLRKAAEAALPRSATDSESEDRVSAMTTYIDTRLAFARVASPQVVLQILDALEVLARKVSELQALSVTNLMLAVVPGEAGGGKEVNAKSVEEVVNKLSVMAEANENMLTERDTLRAALFRADLKDANTLDLRAIAVAFNLGASEGTKTRPRGNPYSLGTYGHAAWNLGFVESLAKPEDARWKDGDTAKLVNKLTHVAKTYAGSQQLRLQIAQAVLPFTKILDTEK